MENAILLGSGILLTGLLVLGMHWVARLWARRLGEAAANRSLIKPPPLIRPGFMLIVAILVGGFLLFWFRSKIKTPEWYAKYRLRTEVHHRIKSMGGWDQLLIASKSLIATNQPVVPTWIPPGSIQESSLPALSQLGASLILVHPGFITNTLQIGFYQYRPRASYTIYVAPDYPNDLALRAFQLNVSRQASLRPLAPGVFAVY